jgi:hypothetical protein
MLTMGRRIAPMERVAAVIRRRYGMTQIAFILGSLALYELARYAMKPNWSVAFENAKRVTQLERALRVAWEPALQQAFLPLPSLIEALNVFYFVAHFLLTGVFFLWLYHRSQSGFRAFRDGFFAATMISIFIHWGFPTAPPRLAGIGLVDTLRSFSGIDIGSPSREAFTNPVAAVPSLHAGWAVGVGVGLVRYGRMLVTRVAGVFYPMLVVFTIIVTGNHFVLDAVAGIIVLGIGFLVASGFRRALPGRRRDAAILAAATRGGAVR